MSERDSSDKINRLRDEFFEKGKFDELRSLNDSCLENSLQSKDLDSIHAAFAKECETEQNIAWEYIMENKYEDALFIQKDLFDRLSKAPNPEHDYENYYALELEMGFSMYMDAMEKKELYISQTYGDHKIKRKTLFKEKLIEAIHHMENAVQNSGGNSAAYDYLSEACYFAGETDRAIDYAQTALGINRKTPEEKVSTSFSRKLLGSYNSKNPELLPNWN